MKKLLLLLLITTHIFANIGNIMALKGVVKIKHTNIEKNATSGMEIIEGDTIVTSAKSRAQVILKDNTIVTIGSNSSFQFDKYFFDGTKKSLVKMRANRGFFRSVTGKIGKIAPERFTVETSSATIGIRGTDFSVEMRERMERFMCHRGKISIRIRGRLIELTAGEMFELDPKTLDEIFKGFFNPQDSAIQDMTELEGNEDNPEDVNDAMVDPYSIY